MNDDHAPSVPVAHEFPVEIARSQMPVSGPAWAPAPVAPPPVNVGASNFPQHQVPLAMPGYAMRTDQQPTSAAVIVLAWLITLVTVGYMLPWAVAASRGKSNQGGIAVLNLFLGWTFVGWVIALVMACSSHQPLIAGPTVIVAQQFTGVAPVAPQPPPGWYPSPDLVGQQFWDGQSWTGHRSP
jgi:hypothetical protein